jgi:DNA-binding SARP family transcriptional activator
VAYYALWNIDDDDLIAPVSQLPQRDSTYVHLFGKLSIDPGDGAAAALTRPAGYLVGYLAVNGGRPHRRDLLAETLWPCQDGMRSRSYLRRALWEARRDLVPAARALVADKDWIELRPSAGLGVDVVDFSAAYDLLSRPAGVSHDELFQRCTHAASLYRGDLLEDCYDDWLTLPRERCRWMLVEILVWLVDHTMRSAPRLAQSYCHHLLALDSAHEWAHQSMMRALCAAGDRTRALRQFEFCANRLRAELDIEPSAETCQLREQIIANDPVSRRIPASSARNQPDTRAPDEWG